MEYIFKRGKVINVIKCQSSNNKKLGLYNLVIQTYHIGVEQFSNFRNDSSNCGNCSYSYNMNNGVSGGCYTHKGYQYLGIRAMVKRLSTMNIKSFDKELFNAFVKYISQYDIILCRFGAYGEPINLPIKVIERLIKVSNSHTGYTQQWNNPKYQKYSKYFMASTRGIFETKVANSLGFRAFESSIEKASNIALCPASKKFTGKKKTCVQCKACDGIANGKKNNIFIYKH